MHSKMATTRDRVAWAHIFRLYKRFPHLWDKNNINYGNRSMMTDGYKLLTRVYREKLDKQASVGALRMKMKNLRTTYYRELRKIRDAKIKGKKYTPSLWYFEHLSFLGNPKSKDGTSDPLQNDTNEDSTSIEDLIQPVSSSPVDDLALENSDLEYDTGPSTPQPKSNQITESQTINTVTSERQEYPKEYQSKKNVKDDHWEVIGKSIGYQLKDLNKKQYTMVSKLISDAIYYGRLNKLSEASHIEVGVPHNVDRLSPHTYATSSHYGGEVHEVDAPVDQQQRDRFKHEDDDEDD